MGKREKIAINDEKFHEICSGIQTQFAPHFIFPPPSMPSIVHRSSSYMKNAQLTMLRVHFSASACSQNYVSPISNKIPSRSLVPLLFAIFIIIRAEIR
jgi:hypothetical protein